MSSLGKASHSKQDAPPIAAIFVIKFDQRVGYTLAWQRAIPGLELAGEIEYKSLPSGLHNVKEDFIYFIHSSYAGLCAFKSEEAAESERNAKFVSVGVLVQKHGSRLGRVWLHRDGVEELATRVLADSVNHRDLEQYWEQHRLHHHSHNHPLEHRHSSSTSNDEAQNDALQANQAHLSESGFLTAPESAELVPSHPVLSLVELLDHVGPLIFPLYRAALLRKRIVIIARPPLASICHFVYIISILSSIPSLTGELLPESAPTSSWSTPLFSVGIQDIPFLQSLVPPMPGSASVTPTSGPSEGWIACTSDALLATKDTLSDIRVCLPYSTPFPGRPSSQYTVISATSGRSVRHPDHSKTRNTSTNNVTLKATQRDLRRYKALRLSISTLLPLQLSSQPLFRDTEGRNDLDNVAPRPHSRASTTGTRARYNDNDNDNDVAPLISRRDSSNSRQSHRPRSPNYMSTFQDPSSVNVPFEDETVEPLPWSAALYGSFMWWASGGQRGFEAYDDETEVDRGLWAEAANAAGASTSGNRARPTSNGHGHSGRRGALEMAVIAYFHGLTSRMLETLAGIIEAQTDENDVDSGPEQRMIYITKEDLVVMGLDVWSTADREFARELCQVYYGRDAEIGGSTAVEICGVRIC